MRDEISAAVLFLVRLIERSENFNKRQLDEFKAHLSDLLMARFENHWFPETPFKGQGYRCIRVNECSRRDATLEKAAIACGLKYEDLKLPVELTIWVDPKEVCCRFGEHKGSYCTLASFDQESEVKVFLENCPIDVKPEDLEGVEEIESPPSPQSADESDTPSSPVDEQRSTKELKNKQATTPTTPTSTSNIQRNFYRNRTQNSPRQGNKMGGRPKHWGGPNGYHHHQVQPWYNLPLSLPWLPPSPPPYLMRSPFRPSQVHHPNHNHRYNWPQHKQTLKV